MVENKNVSEKLWRLVGCHDVSQDVMDRKVRHYSRDKHEFDRTKKTGTYRTVPYCVPFLDFHKATYNAGTLASRYKQGIEHQKTQIYSQTSNSSYLR